MSWSARVDPIVLQDGRKLLTLRDAAYITELPKAEHDAAEWQTVMETLLLVAERDGPEMMARIGMMRAMHQRTNSQIAAPHDVANQAIEIQTSTSSRFIRRPQRQTRSA